jgi:hypothetical protein
MYEEEVTGGVRHYRPPTEPYTYGNMEIYIFIYVYKCTYMYYIHTDTFKYTHFNRLSPVMMMMMMFS